MKPLKKAAQKKRVKHFSWQACSTNLVNFFVLVFKCDVYKPWCKYLYAMHVMLFIAQAKGMFQGVYVMYMHVLHIYLRNI